MSLPGALCRRALAVQQTESCAGRQQRQPPVRRTAPATAHLPCACAPAGHCGRPGRLWLRTRTPMPHPHSQTPCWLP
jgi:hypothetical protein